MSVEQPQIISGRLVDLHLRRIYAAEVYIHNGLISKIIEVENAPDVYILPGFVDAHIHIESSMMPPSSFALLAVKQGSVATVSDPHEIANVCGIEGVDYMITDASKTPFHFFFGAPSCVPATPFETNGATLNADSIDYLLRDKNIWFLSEMMNYPAVLQRDPMMMRMIKSAKRYGKPIDGHAPGLRGMDAKIYASAGITTDHECITLEEALEKISARMHILIREGSAAKNFDALHPLIQMHPEKVMFCCDDKHPDELMLHHINEHVRKSLALGYDLFDVLRIACVHPVLHYQLPVGLLREGDSADFIVVKDLQRFEVLHNCIQGQWVVKNAQVTLPFSTPEPINNFDSYEIEEEQFIYRTQQTSCQVRVIVAQDGQLTTGVEQLFMTPKEEILFTDTEQDILKIVVVNRYKQTPPAVGFVKGFGLKSGAIASTVAHDSHNIIAVGVSDHDIAKSVQLLMNQKGGLCCVENNTQYVLPLPIAGLMSDQIPVAIAEQYQQLDHRAKDLGCTLSAPFMTLSFMALPVIPSLKMTDKGLFDVDLFKPIEVEVVD